MPNLNCNWSIVDMLRNQLIYEGDSIKFAKLLVSVFEFFFKLAYYLDLKLGYTK